MTTTRAHELGTLARRNETATAPCQDKTFMGEMIWNTPNTIKFLTAWSKGFHAEHHAITQPIADAILGR